MTGKTIPHSFSKHHIIVVMDDYDPMDAFMRENESRKIEEDQQWQTSVAAFRKGEKRDYADSVSIDPKEILLQGLNKPISNESFGMKMLQKMGFKPGDGLGKDAEGIKEPIPIKLKYDKVGIGHEEEEKRQREESEYEKNIRILRNQLYYNMKKQQYDQHVRQKADRKNLLKDLRQAQSAIEMLDEENGKGRNPLLLSGDDDCDVEVLTGCLEKMIRYLRSTYFYCIYCGCAYEDEVDMNMNCPGWGRDVH